MNTQPGTPKPTWGVALGAIMAMQPAWAQETISLESLLQETLLHNPSLQATQSSYEAASRRPSQAGTLPAEGRTNRRKRT